MVPGNVHPRGCGSGPGISEKAAEDLIRKGKGTSADLLALCEALRVELLSLPGDDELERGME